MITGKRCDESNKESEELVGDSTGGQQRHDVWMLKQGGHLDLEPEPVGAHPARHSGESTLITTRRRSAFSVARKTRDMPPPPSSRSMV